MERKKKIIFILILILLLILLLIFIILLKNSINIQNNREETIGEENISLKLLKDNSIFYTISNKVNKYLIDIANKDSESLYNQLDIQYINENNINKNNVLSSIDRYSTRKSFSMEKAYYITKNKVSVYVVSGEIKTDSINETRDESKYSIIVKLDTGNMTYSIYPYKYSSIDEININELVKMATSVEKNNINTFSLPLVNNLQISKGYFVIYKGYVASNPEKAYSILEKTYRDKRFGSFEKYKNYIEEMSKNNNNREITEYAVNVYDEYKDYICKDNYGYYCIFRETSPTQFTVLLDSYTVKLEDTVSKYEKSNNEQKAAMHVQTFIEMINTKDYTAAYKVLAQGFKQNYFKDEDTFKKFAKSAFFECNKIKSASAEKKDDYYVITVTIQDYKDLNKELKPINFVVNIKENMEFELSFGSN